ncbi:hypothetical protein [Erythrobacter sp.]|uniref:hypothetical protein n=1 Tax=Erythrobacter sp. TaxID=1042 RepID=UPI001425CF2D|nr:hypothetical protein [Erythrobacter sp.]QIQ86486.1 MAG: hypothetical protein G9473_07125 [Erythrobacter sp.]
MSCIQRPARLGLAPLAALAMAGPLAADPPPTRVIVTPAPTESDAPPPAASPARKARTSRFERARANLLAIEQGRLSLGELTRQDLRDVIELERILRDDRKPVTTHEEQCIAMEVRREGGRPSRLAWHAIRLKCREIGG